MGLIRFTPRNFRKAVMMALKLFLIVATIGIFLIGLFIFYGNATFRGRGNIVLALVYTLIFVLFAMAYDSFRIGVSRRGEIVFSYILSIFLTNMVTYFILCLIAGVMLNPFPLFLQLCIQALFGAIFYTIAYQVYFTLYPARDTMVILSNAKYDMETMQKFYQRKDRYDIRLVCSEAEGEEALKRKIDGFSTIVIGNVEKTLRQDLISYCFQQNKRLFLMPKMNDIILHSAHETFIGDSLVYLCKNRGFSVEQLCIKRLLDIVISGIGLIVCSPLMLIIAICIKLYDRGPVFYRQTRYTRNMEQFTMIKFRSMIVNAEANGAQFTVPNDKRITPIGKLIRATRFDEIPQLWNILKGEMSLVGPRAERVENADYYCKQLPEFAYRTKVKAGLTGYAQIYGKYNTSFENKLKMDLLYIENASLLLDLRLMFLTLKVIFMRESTEGFDVVNLKELNDEIPAENTNKNN